LSSLTLCFPIGFHFLAYPNLFGIKGFVVVVVVVENRTRELQVSFLIVHDFSIKKEKENDVI
jgi:hypothetical protein